MLRKKTRKKKMKMKEKTMRANREYENGQVALSRSLGHDRNSSAAVEVSRSLPGEVESHYACNKQLETLVQRAHNIGERLHGRSVANNPEDSPPPAAGLIDGLAYGNIQQRVLMDRLDIILREIEGALDA